MRDFNGIQGRVGLKDIAMNVERVTCIKNQGYPVSLILGNTYDTLFDEADEDAIKHGLIRVIDETGEDYLYPASYFVAGEAIDDSLQRQSHILA